MYKVKAGTYKKDFFKLKITKKGPDFLEVFQFMKLSWKIDTHNLTATSYLNNKSPGTVSGLSTTLKIHFSVFSPLGLFFSD